MKIYFGYANNTDCIYEVYTMDCEYSTDSERYLIETEIYTDKQPRCMAYSIHKLHLDKVNDCMAKDFGIYTIYSLDKDIIYQEIENIKKQNKINLQEKLRDVEKPIVSFDRTI